MSNENHLDNPIMKRYATAWATVKNPPLDSVNPHFKNRYASLQATMDVIRDACIPNGLCYRQGVVRMDGESLLVSFIYDIDGNFFQLSDMWIPDNADRQKSGSDLTYSKRQLAQLDWGIVGEEDDDGESGTREEEQKPITLEEAKSQLTTAVKALAQKDGTDWRELAQELMSGDDYAKNKNNAQWYLNMAKSLKAANHG